MLVNKSLALYLGSPDVYAPAAPLGKEDVTLSTLVNPIISNVLIVSGIVAFFTIIFAGFSYVTAAGDKNKVAQAQLMLNYGIIGLVVVVAAFIVTRLMGSILGFKFL